MRMRRAPGEADTERLRDHRLDRQPVDRRAVAPRRLDAARIDRQADRYFARDDELAEQRVPAAPVGAQPREAIEDPHCSRLAPELDDAREPYDVAGLQADAAFPFRIEEP